MLRVILRIHHLRLNSEKKLLYIINRGEEAREQREEERDGEIERGKQQ